MTRSKHPPRTRHPALGELETALDQDATIEALTRAARDLLADDGWTGSLIESAAAALRTDARAIVPFHPAENEIKSGLVVLDRPRLRITLDVVHAARLAMRKNRPRTGSIGFSGEIGIVRFVKSGGAVLSFWEAPPIDPDFRAELAGTCRETGRCAVADGEVIVVDGRRESFIVEAARSNLLLVAATIRTEAPVCVEYDAETGAYLGCSAVDDRDSRLQMIATLARLLGADQAFPAIAGLLDHPSFFVRWHAMRELIGIDADAALPYLRLLATHDPHADVRAAANATLDLVAAPAGRRAA